MSGERGCADRPCCSRSTGGPRGDRPSCCLLRCANHPHPALRRLQQHKAAEAHALHSAAALEPPCVRPQPLAHTPWPPPGGRYPFLLVDRVLEWEYGKYAVGYKCVTVSAPEQQIIPP